ncbi:MaoC family dehydratase N-terminal domain-containing protein [Rhizobium sp. CCGE 510]|uniref:FAS1-like dehydratase domain-containing protein n=1 Tax=Rhizobium sp. CCGE 510 TaxID=1132836 RepID=UPI00027B83FB|nr:MaoC family dehydratase N-terminal domain-containing protein [Rhizobium sp. CCGE 510]EJT04270.1 hypothetical protein RCCGE510_15662 [Rhizobium sp. CCGE 510]
MSDSANPDVDHLRSWIGRETRDSDLVSVDLVKKFNATFGLSTAEPAWGSPAPLLVHYCLAQPTGPTDDLADDGHPHRGGFLPPVPLPRRMWAGSSLSFHGDLKVGDLVMRTSRIADVVYKDGRSGKLCFVAVEHKVEVAGSLKIEETQNIVYREASQGEVERRRSEIAPIGAWTRAWNVSSPLLFRYSAITFNAHRIHYDRGYATTVENYPGLVVHGPMQATALLNYAAEIKGGRPNRYTFRSEAPMFDCDTAHLHAADKNGSLALWTATDTGPVALNAEAWW